MERLTVPRLTQLAPTVGQRLRLDRERGTAKWRATRE